MILTEENIVLGLTFQKFNKKYMEDKVRKKTIKKLKVFVKKYKEYTTISLDDDTKKNDERCSKRSC